MNFEERYKKLNTAQKRAVDTIDGPVMVVAGPGTGKTELLSIRTANILRETDVLPSNILCLTFTESGARAMRERLTTIIGQDAYKVAIHTFHGFGTEIINRFGEYFYQGALFRPADDISRREILDSIFDELDHDNPLASKMNGDYTYLREVERVIGELKKSGLTGDELLAVLDTNEPIIDTVTDLLAEVLAERVSKQTPIKLAEHLETIRGLESEIVIDSIVPLTNILADSLQTALEMCESEGNTKAITAWKANYWKKSSHGTFELKDKDRQKKLRTISLIYTMYLTRMQEAQLYDYDDMILRVVHAMEVFDDLRYSLQEQYQYIMVDEFQDTNMAQMRIIHNLTLSSVLDNTPNILVVGDDDQAIYSFQGADVSNILSFRTIYPGAELITLTDNYRSIDDVLTVSRSVITQGFERLENSIPEINKQLHANNTADGGVVLNEYPQFTDEVHALTSEISLLIRGGTKPSEIAVLTRKHSGIESILGYFAHADIPVVYERRDNILELPSIQIVITIARVLRAIKRGNVAEINQYLPEVVAHPAFRFAPEDIWKISLEAYRDRLSWLEVLQKTPGFTELSSWLISTALAENTLPFEDVLDDIIGSVPSTDYVSPFFKYYFDKDALEENAMSYLVHIQALRTLRTKIREHNPADSISLESFIHLIDAYNRISQGISMTYTVGDTESGVQIMTAHRAKGLEFDHVYIIDATETSWGDRARSAPRMISYPENLPLAPAGDDLDDKLRLFYVAMTRARQTLTVSYSRTNDSGKATEQAGFLLGASVESRITETTQDAQAIIEHAEHSWHDSILPEASGDLRAVLSDMLSSYQLNTTHLTNYLDITRGGPRHFLLQNLLRFPQAMNPAASYGSSIHYALQKAHQHLIATKNLQPIEDIIGNFSDFLARQRLSDVELKRYTKKGRDDLMSFLTSTYDSFSIRQKPEVSFASESVHVADAHITGILDVLEQTDDGLKVIDYKTGSPTESWAGKSDYEKIKLHNYRLQLSFYKLLIENSRTYSGRTVREAELQYIEPSKAGECVTLRYTYNSDDLERTEKLIRVVWTKIQSLDFPDTSHYPQNYSGIQAFEQDLLDGII